MKKKPTKRPKRDVRHERLLARVASLEKSFKRLYQRVYNHESYAFVIPYVRRDAKR